MNWKFSGDRPVYQQIMELMRGGIVKGELPPGGKIPSVRELAAQAQVNPNTMQRQDHLYQAGGGAADPHGRGNYHLRGENRPCQQGTGFLPAGSHLLQ